jgi:hypothetical protein
MAPNMWQTILRFGDAHPWFVPFIAGIVVLLTAGYKTFAWSGAMIASAWHRHEGRRVLRYLATQINPGPFVEDAYGHIPRLQKDCFTIDIAGAVRRKPARTHEILEQLKTKRLVEQRGRNDLWCISEFGLAEIARRGWKIWRTAALL